MAVIPPWLTLIILGLLLAGCGSQPLRTPLPPPVETPVPAALHETSRVSALVAQYRQWQGTPYRLGGNGRDGIDCSGFVQQVFRAGLGQPLPRTTEAQHQLGRAASRAELAAGDLVFFKTSAKVRHVGIYLEHGRFLHASTSRGVMVSNLDNPYWRRHYWKARRVLDP